MMCKGEKKGFIIYGIYLINSKNITSGRVVYSERGQVKSNSKGYHYCIKKMRSMFGVVGTVDRV